MPRYTFKLSSLLLTLMASSVVWAGGRWVTEEICIRDNQTRLLGNGRPLLDRVLNDGQGEYHLCVFSGALVVTDRLYGQRLIERLPLSDAAHMVLRQPNLLEVHFCRGYAQYEVTQERIKLVYQSEWVVPDDELEMRFAETHRCSCMGCLTRGWQWSRY
jgi:hypothetical protein